MKLIVKLLQYAEENLSAAKIRSLKKNIISITPHILFITILGWIITDALIVSVYAFLGQDKKEVRHGLKILGSYFRDALVYKETVSADMIINADDLAVVSSLANRLRGEQILENLSIVEKSGEMIELNVNKSLTLEAMAFKLHM